MASSSLMANVIPSQIIVTTDGISGCLKSDTWYHMVCTLLLVQDCNPTNALCCTQKKMYSPLLPVRQEKVWDKFCGQLVGEARLLNLKGRGIGQDLIPYVGQLDFGNVPINGWIIDPNVHGLLFLVTFVA